METPDYKELARKAARLIRDKLKAAGVNWAHDPSAEVGEWVVVHVPFDADYGDEPHTIVPRMAEPLADGLLNELGDSRDVVFKSQSVPITVEYIHNVIVDEVPIRLLYHANIETSRMDVDLSIQWGVI